MLTFIRVNEEKPLIQSFAIKDGRFIGLGTSKEIKKNFKAASVVDLEGKTVLPGLIDGHCHFNNLGIFMQTVDLTGTTSYKEILQRVSDFQKEKNVKFIRGRGWDQNDWEVKEYPTKNALDKMFPNIPIALTRIDGHALLVNQAALDVAGIDDNTKISGGEIVKKNGKITGRIGG